MKLILSLFLAAFAFTAQAVEVPQTKLDALNLSVQDLNDKVKALTTAPIPPDPVPVACANPKTITVDQSKGQVPSTVLASQLTDCSLVLLDGDWADCFSIAKNDVTIKTKPGAPRARLRDKSCEAKGLILSRGKNLRVEGLELTGAKGGSGNEAGIRQEGAGLTVFDTYIHDNYNGILNGNLTTARPVPDDAILIERSRFERNGGDGGQSHNIYAGAATKSLTILNSEFIQPQEGHNVKARIKSPEGLTIKGSVLAMLSGNGSRSIDMSIGGKLTIEDTVIQQVGQQQWAGGVAQNSDVIGWRREFEYIGGVQTPWVKPTGDTIKIADSLAVLGSGVGQFIYGGDATIDLAGLKVVAADPSLPEGAYRFVLGRNPDGTTVYPYPYAGPVTVYKDAATGGLPAYDGTMASIPRPAAVAGLVTPLRGTVPDPTPDPIPDPTPGQVIIPPPGEWAMVPNSDISKVFPPITHPSFVALKTWGVVGPSSVIGAWNSASTDRATGEIHISHAGGHADYAGNEDYKIDLLSGKGWVRWSDPSMLDGNVPAGQPFKVLGTPRPAPTHNFAGTVWIPTLKAVLSVDNSMYPIGGTGFQAWLTYPETKTYEELVLPKWPQYTPTISHLVWAKDHGVAINFRDNLEIFDPATRKIAAQNYVNGYTNWVGDGAASYDHDRHIGIWIDRYANGFVLADVRDRTKISWTPFRFSAMTDTPSIVSGIAYHAPSKRFLFWAGTTEVIALDVSNWAADRDAGVAVASRRSPSFKRIPYAGSTVLPKPVGNPVYGRWDCIDPPIDVCWGMHWVGQVAIWKPSL